MCPEESFPLLRLRVVGVFEPNDLLRTGIASARGPAVHGALSYRAQSARSGELTPQPASVTALPHHSVQRRQRLGGMLSYYHRGTA
jgi:hypothetical protein